MIYRGAIEMKTRYYKRAFLWITQLSITLLIFWLKNPKETSSVIKFFFKKTLAFPRFLNRNVLTEKHSESFKNRLEKVSKLYIKFSSKFNPSDPRSYFILEDVLSSKSELLYFLVRKLKPGIVLETGVAAGESTGFILKAMKENKKGQLYSIDLPFQWYIYGDHELHLDSLPAGKMPGYLVPENLKENWHLILGNTYDQLPKLLKVLKTIDIFLHDSEHTDKTMMFEYDTTWPFIKKGGLLLSDDVSYTKAFSTFFKMKKLKNIIFKDLGVISKNG